MVEVRIIGSMVKVGAGGGYRLKVQGMDSNPANKCYVGCRYMYIYIIYIFIFRVNYR